MILDQLHRLLSEAVAHIAGDLISWPLPEIEIEIPPQETYGDFSSNIALQVSRRLRRPPLQVAEQLKQAMPESPLVEEIKVMPPGFLNFLLTPQAYSQLLAAIAEKPAEFTQVDVGKGRKAMVEFVSANPTGPLHIGHGRNAVFGDALARLLEKVGYEVTREYYFNDVGAQMKKLGESLRARYLQLLGESAELPQDGYQGEYLIDVARQLQEEKGSAAREQEPDFFIDYACAAIFAQIKEDLTSLGITFDTWTSEADFHHRGEVEEVIEELKKRQVLYEKEGAWWLASSQFGDEKDRVVVKSDGETTYLAPDITYHRSKYERGFELLVNVFGGDHHGYVARLKAGIAALGLDASRLHCIILQMVTLIGEGELAKLSTRRGQFITLREMLQELSRDVVRIFFLLRRADAQLPFDWQLARSSTPDNPVFYLQYAYARTCSVFRKAEEKGIVWEGSKEAAAELLTLPEERRLLRRMAMYREALRRSAVQLEPFIFLNYLLQLVEAFHHYFTLGAKDPTVRILLDDEPELTQARLSLLHSFQLLLADAFSLLGIEAKERM